MHNFYRAIRGGENVTNLEINQKKEEKITTHEYLTLLANYIIDKDSGEALEYRQLV